MKTAGCFFVVGIAISSAFTTSNIIITAGIKIYVHTCNSFNCIIMTRQVMYYDAVCYRVSVSWCGIVYYYMMIL